MPTLTLRSRDGLPFHIEKTVAMLSGTVKRMIQDDRTADIVNFDAMPVVNVDWETLCTIFMYLIRKVTISSMEVIVDWEPRFIAQVANENMLYDVMMGSIELEATGLLDLCLQKLADMIKGKATVEEIRRSLNFNNDLSPEEEEEIIAEYASFFPSSSSDGHK